MKNSLNLGFVVLLLVVLGCSCPKMDELANSSTPSSTPSTANSSNSSSTSSTDTSSTALTMAKYEEIKNGMTKAEVEKILGSKGTELSSSTGGGYTFAMYQWKGENYSSLTVMFQNDKVTSKSQYGLK